MTGGGGYVGSRLAKQLAADGYRVTTFDVRYFEQDNDSRITRIKVPINGPVIYFNTQSWGISGRHYEHRRTERCRGSF